MRQLLDLYDRGDAQEEQLRRTYEVAHERLAQMERQRDELNEAIEELRGQLEWGAEMIASFRRTAAE
jgi:DNA-binding transcriptional MerR regulator